LRKLLPSLALLFFVGCATVTIKPGNYANQPKLSSSPTYQESKPYFLWGLVGEHTIDVQEVCGGRECVQMQSQYTFLDGFLSFLTIGLYSPKTAKVWCEGGSR